MMDHAEVIEIAPEDVQPFGQSVRAHGEVAIRAVDAALNEFGEYEPIVLSSTDEVLYGEERVKAAVERGDTEITAVRVDTDGWDDERLLALHLALHKVKGQWDDLRLKSVLEDLTSTGFEMVATGFLQSELDVVLGAPKLPPDAPGQSTRQKDVPQDGDTEDSQPEKVERFRCGMVSFKIPVDLKERLDEWVLAHRAAQGTKDSAVEAILVAMTEKLTKLDPDA